MQMCGEIKYNKFPYKKTILILINNIHSRLYQLNQSGFALHQKVRVSLITGLTIHFFYPGRGAWLLVLTIRWTIVQIGNSKKKILCFLEILLNSTHPFCLMGRIDFRMNTVKLNKTNNIIIVSLLIKHSYYLYYYY